MRCLRAWRPACVLARCKSGAVFPVPDGARDSGLKMARRPRRGEVVRRLLSAVSAEQFSWLTRKRLRGDAGGQLRADCVLSLPGTSVASWIF